MLLYCNAILDSPEIDRRNILQTHFKYNWIHVFSIFYKHSEVDTSECL